MKSITIGKKTILWVVILSIIIGAAIATATYLVGEFKIGYRIEPTTSEAVTLNPNPISLDLGTLPSGSIGEIDFGNCCRLSLADNYRVTFELDGYDDFEDFTVRIWIYSAGTTTYGDLIYLWSKGISQSDFQDLDAGDYDLYIEVDYNAKHVTGTSTGEVKISISY